MKEESASPHTVSPTGNSNEGRFHVEAEAFPDLPFSTAAGSVFILSFAVLAFEVVLTRLFSVFLRYHFVFLIVSVAVCGLGIGGLLLYQCRNLLSRLPPRLFLFLNLLGLALSIPAFVLLVLRWLVPHYPGMVSLMAMLMLVPFLFAGAFLAYVFERLALRSGQLYAADLTGAAIAAVVVIGLLKVLGAVDACFALSIVVAISALALIAPPTGITHRRAILVLGATVVLLLNTALLALNRRTRFADVPPIRTNDPEVAQQITKPLFRELADPSIGARIVRTEWSAFARTDVVEEADAPEVKYIWTDGEVPTHMEKFDGDLSKVQVLKRFIGYLPYATGRVNTVLCIGPGGGLDILLAKLGEAKHIEGVEVNPSIPRLMSEYADFNGNLYEQPDVHISVADGRSFVRHSSQRYDLIYLALTQTATSGNVGLALVESYIHTTDALRDYLDHLTPNGRVAFITQEYALLCRYFTSALKVFLDKGIPEREACEHLALFAVPPTHFAGNPYRHLILVHQSRLSPQQADKLLSSAQQMGLDPLYVPHVYRGKPFARVSAGELDLEDFISLFRQYDRVNISPVSDDSPFFLDLTLSVPSLLTQLWIGALLLVMAFSVWAVLGVKRDSALRLRRRRSLPFVAYFSALGIGFMLVEVALAQKMILFLGYPTLALSVILCSLLLGGGCGSFVSQRLDEERLATGIARAAGGVVIMVAFLELLMPRFLGNTHMSSVTSRSLLGALLLLPLGFFLGMPFPFGVRLLQMSSPEDVPWMWGVNGVTSVVGSVLAAVGAKLWGFHEVLLIGAAVYCLLMVSFIGISRSGQKVTPSSPLESATG